MVNLLKQLVVEERGLEMVEWGVVAALLTTAAAITLQILQVTLNLRLTEVWATLLRI